ncbi:MAG: Dabb family protein [Candidatus Scalindua sp. AMX11]|nr:MAG: Dabb family protein [Candidatus Scalindua sp.]NOG85291.1 Dabb family protein [Planctomycetota bacterium]RZV81490.1 MAG: Dabb family protein [Candidatus Scalindua sp. SCAELEC01]TDE65436.1 MAG: Dabb family protein [Candidatus Scalindua sp. AMX11]GJQ59359.1 MAG: stress responsive protein [Candidatus Scalindua sp.]
MIKHIVMWRLHQQAENNDKGENAKIAKEKLESLNGKVPGLSRLEVGYDYSQTDASADLVLYSEFESQEALTCYQNHPEHKLLLPFMSAICSERRVVDYEV